MAKPLTDALRAAVFARDKAVCAFSGLSVWTLDYGTAPFAQSDWADHVRPASRGGGTILDNLVCASHFYNYKKRSNASDRAYLFRGGKPTEWFYWTHGELTAGQAELLARHAQLTEADWYYNRALSSIHVALHTEWQERTDIRRRADYWLKAACQKLRLWRRLSGETSGESFLRRDLVRYPQSPDVRLMLKVAEVDRPGLRELFDGLLAHYRANADALHAFATADAQSRRRAVVDEAEENEKVTEPLLVVLRRNLSRLDTLPEGRIQPPAPAGP